MDSDSVGVLKRNGLASLERLPSISSPMAQVEKPSGSLIGKKQDQFPEMGQKELYLEQNYALSL
jgi:hypothetical protein